MRPGILVALLVIFNVVLMVLWITREAPVAPPPPVEVVAPYPSTPDSQWAKIDSGLTAWFVRLGMPPKSVVVKEGDVLPNIFSTKRKHYKIKLPKVYAPGMFQYEVSNIAHRWGGYSFGVDQDYNGKTFTVNVYLGDVLTHEMMVQAGQDLDLETGYLALLIDGLGDTLTPRVDSLLSSPLPLTLSVIPFLRNSRIIGTFATQRNKELLVHLPMEPETYPKFNPGPHAIYMHLTPPEIHRRTRAAMDELKGAKGMNNWMGSRVTPERTIMNPVMSELSKDGWYFVDMRTSNMSVAYSCAREQGIPATTVGGYLDNVDTTMAYMQKRFIEQALRTRLSERGTIIECHLHVNLIKFLRDLTPLAEKYGIKLVPVSSVVDR